MGSLSMDDCDFVDDCDFGAWLDLDSYDDDDSGSSGGASATINDNIVVHHDHHDDHHDHHDDDQELVQCYYEYSEESEVERFLRESYSNLVDSEPNVDAAEAASRISEEQRLEVERFLRESYENLVNPQPPNNYDHAIAVDDNEPPNREIDQRIPSPSNRKRGKMADEVEWPSSQPNKKRKMKTLKVSASALCIGTWQWVAKNQEDVVTKCYYAKKRLIWELLENGLKKKMEIHWDQISAMRVITTESGHMILEIEVREPPSFFHEKEPQPGHHTLWENATDFTEGNALTYRIHSMQFSPGVFDKPYKQLLHYVPRFELMCRAPFPTPGVSPRFVEFDLEFGEDIYADCQGAKSPIKALPHDYEAWAASANGPENGLNTALATRQTVISPAATDQILHHQWQSTPYDHDHHHQWATVILDESLSLTDPERHFLYGQFAPWHGPADHHERLYSHQGLCGEAGDFEAEIGEWRSFYSAASDYERRLVLEQPEPNGPADCPATATSDDGGPIGQGQNCYEASASQENGQNSGAREDQPSFEFVRESVMLLSTMDLGPYNFS